MLPANVLSSITIFAITDYHNVTHLILEDKSNLLSQGKGQKCQNSTNMLDTKGMILARISTRAHSFKQSYIYGPHLLRQPELIPISDVI